MNHARKASPQRCCHLCNPDLLVPYAASNVHDPWLSAHAALFIYPLVDPNDKSPTITTVRPTAWTAFVLPEGVTALEDRLVKCQEAQHVAAGSPSLLSPALFLPPKQLKSLCSEAKRIAGEATITPAFIQKVVPLVFFHSSGVAFSHLHRMEARYRCAGGLEFIEACPNK